MATGVAATNYLENAALDHILGKGLSDMTSPATLALALHSGDPTETGGGNELANSNGYARQAMTFAAASGGTKATSNAQVFTASGGDWSQATYVSIWDSATYGAGNCLFYGAMSVAKTVQDGDSLTFAIGDITVSMD